MSISSYSNPTVSSIIIICTSSTRPSSPVDGQTIYETDTDIMRVWNGTTWDLVSYADGTTLEISGNSLRIKDAGVTSAKIAEAAKYKDARLGEKGVIVAGTGTSRFYFDEAVTLKDTRASLGTAGTSDTTIDVNKNGTTIFTSTKLVLGNGAYTVTQSGLGTTSMSAGDYLTVDIDSVGTGSPANLVVTIRYYV